MTASPQDDIDHTPYVPTLERQVHLIACAALGLDDEDHENDEEAKPLEDAILALIHDREARAEEKRIEWLDDQVRHVLFDIYPEDVFTPPTKEDYAKANEFDAKLHTRLHCDGIRHGLQILRREARGLSARDDLAALHTTKEGKEHEQ